MPAVDSSDGYDYDEDWAQVQAIRTALKLDTNPLPTMAELAADPWVFAEECLWVKPKFGAIKPLEWKPIQAWIHLQKAEARARGYRKFIELKARRMGFTTYEQAMSFHLVTMHNDKTCTTVAHTDKDAIKIFRMVELFLELLPDFVRPATTPTGNKRKVEYPERRSIFEIGTAGARGFARGSANDRLHLSEAAHYPGTYDDQLKFMAGALESATHGECVAESTANGYGNWFERTFTEAQRGENDWFPIFRAWFHDSEHALLLSPRACKQVMNSLSPYEEKLVAVFNLRPQQIAWYRMKLRELKELMPQEYPSTPEEAFVSSGLCFFNSTKVAELSLACRDAERTKIPGGFYTRWEEPVPFIQDDEKEIPVEFVIGADTSEGVPGGDPNGFGCLNRNGTMASEAHGWFPPRQLAQLCKDESDFYNGALVAIERNNHGHAVIQEAENLGMGVPHFRGGSMYYHTKGKHYENSKPGWPTDSVTRPQLLNGLRMAIEGEEIECLDRALLQEMLRFKQQPSGRYEAVKPDTDDRIFKWGIAVQMLAHRVERPIMEFVGRI